ncbi:MAG: DUF4157 domain-containing protein [Actinomycetota bacterium]|nr:DUF4157 domain-containing protein [Actinomycetota bacterium]
MITPRPPAAPRRRNSPSDGRPLLTARGATTATSAGERATAFATATLKRPLERPRPLPEGVAPLARLLAPGRQVRFTAGPNTRAALAAADAHAATTASGIHLPTPPTPNPAALEVLAHELSHVTDGSPRTQFLLRSTVGTPQNQGERRARRWGDLVHRIALEPPHVSSFEGGGVRELPVGGGLAEAGEVARTVAARGLAKTIGPTLAPPPTPASSGLSSALPATPPSSPTLPDGGLAATVQGSGPHSILERGAGATGRVAAGAGAPTAADVYSVSAATDFDSRIDELIEALQERLLVEIERRGGRYAGVF